MTADANNLKDNEEPERRELLVLHAGRRSLGVFTDQVNGIATGKSPTPLPRAPESILGVISFRGRMLTVIDPLPLLGESANVAEPAIIVALNGEEQLALAADSSGGAIQVSSGDIQISAAVSGSEIICGTVRRDGVQIDVMEISGLFRATMRQQERRRRRF